LQIKVLFYDSSVGIAIGYELDDPGSRVRFPAGVGNFSLHHRIQTGSGAHPASYSKGTGDLSLGVKRPGREADHSPPSSAEVKNAWNCTSTPPIRLLRRHNPHLEVLFINSLTSLCFFFLN
jgi:hypothetical protein